MQSVAMSTSTSQPARRGATTSRSFETGEKQASTSRMSCDTAFIVQAQPLPVTSPLSSPSSAFANADTCS